MVVLVVEVVGPDHGDGRHPDSDSRSVQPGAASSYRKRREQRREVSQGFTSET